MDWVTTHRSARVRPQQSYPFSVRPLLSRFSSYQSTMTAVLTGILFSMEKSSVPYIFAETMATEKF